MAEGRGAWVAEKDGNLGDATIPVLLDGSRHELLRSLRSDARPFASEVEGCGEGRGGAGWSP